MANEQNLKPIKDSERARELQAKSVDKRYENKIKRGLIADAILKELTEDDLREIARGIIDRSKVYSSDMATMRDTIGEKPTDKVSMAIIEDEGARELDEYFATKYGELPEDRAV